MLDHEQRTAVIDQPFEGRQQLGDVVEVQAGSRLVADEERAFVGGLREMRRQLDALGFAARKRRGRLAQAQIAQADFVQQLQLA